MFHWRVTSESLGVDHIFEGDDDGILNHLNELMTANLPKAESDRKVHVIAADVIKQEGKPTDCKCVSYRTVLGLKDSPPSQDPMTLGNL